MLSANYRNDIAAERNIPFRSAAELASQSLMSVPWVACPFVAMGAITLVIGKVKSAGKTTLLTHLVRCVVDGASFLGKPTSRGPVVSSGQPSIAACACG